MSGGLLLPGTAGPAQVLSGYTASGAAGLGFAGAAPSNQQTFGPLGEQTQTFTVPADITSIAVDMMGAAGGTDTASSAAPGGVGARLQGALTVTPGEVLTIYVGCCPVSQVSGYGYHSGGIGAGTIGTAGGGSTAILSGGTLIAEAGGGGGGGTANVGTAGAGGAGGAPSASAGADGSDGASAAGGGGATETTGGSAGHGTYESGGAGTVGGAAWVNNGGVGTYYGGAGGGGTAGGGGGGTSTGPDDGGGGGGGSSTVPNGWTAANPSAPTGGYVTLRW